MKVLMCRVGKEAELIEIENSLETMQELVGGYIEPYYPYEDDVAIICNEEGKMFLEPNRPVITSDGRLIDYIFGDFFLCGNGDEDFEDFPEELVDKYKYEMDRNMLLTLILN